MVRCVWNVEDHCIYCGEGATDKVGLNAPCPWNPEEPSALAKSVGMGRTVSLNKGEKHGKGLKKAPKSGRR